jgi:hypothetical protein
MDPKLKELLRHNGVGEDVIAKLERGDPPPEGTLRKSADEFPWMRKAHECEWLLDEIKSSLDAIRKADMQRGALQNFVTGTPVNGVHHTVDGIDLEKGTPK